jgi:hypothetical protein
MTAMTEPLPYPWELPNAPTVTVPPQVVKLWNDVGIQLRKDQSGTCAREQQL